MNYQKDNGYDHPATVEETPAEVLGRFIDFTHNTFSQNHPDDIWTLAISDLYDTPGLYDRLLASYEQNGLAGLKAEFLAATLKNKSMQSIAGSVPQALEKIVAFK